MKGLARGIGFLVIALALASCAASHGSPGLVEDLQPGQRPPAGSDEAGFWMVMDRSERDLRTSGRLLPDARVTEYVRGVVCRLVPEHCRDIRVYVVETPQFNASMAPNGAMQVWTGLLLRAQNEAQLAYVLGHEVGHYLRRHTVQRWRDARSKTDFLAVFSLVTAGAGVGIVGAAANLAGIASIYAFSRDNEREADEVGFRLMLNAGYDPREAPRIWQGILKERDAGKQSSPSIFFATHPATEERVKTLTALAAKEAAGPSREWTTGRVPFLTAIAPVRGTLLRDELARRDFAQTQVVLDRLLETGAGLGELYFFQGELYRRRAQDGDDAKAIAAYARALEHDDAPPETYRGLALCYSKRQHRDEARAALDRYLQARPDAADRELLRAEIDSR